MSAHETPEKTQKAEAQTRIAPISTNGFIRVCENSCNSCLKFFGARRITRLCHEASAFAQGSGGTRRRGRQRMILIWSTKHPVLRAKATAWQARNDPRIFATNSRTMPGSQPCRAAASLRDKKRHGVRSCRTPCLERLTSLVFPVQLSCRVMDDVLCISIGYCSCSQ